MRNQINELFSLKSHGRGGELLSGETKELKIDCVKKLKVDLAEEEYFIVLFVVI